jgi:hypothetical protein
MSRMGFRIQQSNSSSQLWHRVNMFDKISSACSLAHTTQQQQTSFLFTNKHGMHQCASVLCSDAENSKQGRIFQEIIAVCMKPYDLQKVEIKSLPAEVKNNEKQSMKSVSEIHRHNIRMRTVCKTNIQLSYRISQLLKLINIH